MFYILDLYLNACFNSIFFYHCYFMKIRICNQTTIFSFFLFFHICICLSWLQFKFKPGMVEYACSPSVWGYFIVLIKYNHRKQFREKGFIVLTILTVHWRNSGRELKQDRNLEAGTDVEAMEEYCFLACFLCLAKPAFL